MNIRLAWPNTSLHSFPLDHHLFFLWVPSSHPVCISLCSHTPSNQSRLLSSVKFLTSLHLLLWLNGHGTLLCDPSIMRVSHCMSVGSVYTKWTTGNLMFSSANNFNLPIKLLLSAQYHLTGYEYVFFYVWMCVCVYFIGKAVKVWVSRNGHVCVHQHNTWHITSSAFSSLQKTSLS